MPEWAQYAAVFVAVAGASAWLTSRWLLRRNASACGSCAIPCAARSGDGPCAREAHGSAEAHGDPAVAHGIRSPELRVMKQ